MATLSVLIVEDDAMISMVLAEMLTDMGYGICAIAATENDAVAEAARCKPGLMIVDHYLLEGSGWSAVERILQTGPVPFVFISGAPAYAQRVGVTTLQKPFFEVDLIRAIRQAVGGVDVPALLPFAAEKVNLNHL